MLARVAGFWLHSACRDPDQLAADDHVLSLPDGDIVDEHAPELSGDVPQTSDPSGDPLSDPGHNADQGR
ncbi:hypothetical protein NDU88_001137 [Pleurodeles waltl]|uniref:Uncharacterized protein n=1 Tax=Pleurodeles waltl TaxID=8319 RepID=A0AAV7TGY6_PLEWA|nr:hypothetical protein NDU88_001137 [Pleurodeles waltl]